MSYVFEDRTYLSQMEDWATRGLLGVVEIVSETDDVRQHGTAAIRSHLRPIMRSADAILVLVGQDSHSRRRVDEEIHYFRSSSKPVLAVRLPNTTGAAPHEIRGQKLEAFTLQDVKSSLDRLSDAK